MQVVTPASLPLELVEHSAIFVWRVVETLCGRPKAPLHETLLGVVLVVRVPLNLVCEVTLTL